MKRRLLLLALALAACGPERGAGIHRETPEALQARQQAEFEAGEKLGLPGLHRELRALGVENAEIAQVTEPDHGLAVLELRIGPERLADLDAERLARLTLDSNFRLTFADPAVEHAVPTSEEVYRRELMREIAVLKAHGDWDRVPRQERGESLGALARRIEDWCDFDPGGALRVIDGAWLEYSHAPVDAAAKEPQPGRETARFDCLRRVVYATQLRRHFIGYRGEPPPPVYPPDGPRATDSASLPSAPEGPPPAARRSG